MGSGKCVSGGPTVAIKLSGFADVVGSGGFEVGIFSVWSAAWLVG